jgi:anion-transporting  ArsA/GET3 family ATPase
VVLDAPATGHALGLLDSPRTFGAIARVGPIAGQADRLGKLLADPTRSGYVAVAHPTEMAITETLDLQERLHEQLGRDLDAVIVNGVLPQRFSGPELERLGPLPADAPNGGTRTRGEGDRGGRRASSTAVRRSALVAARAVSERARFQHNQLARLRRRKFEVINVPFQFAAKLDLTAIGGIAEHLRRKL